MPKVLIISSFVAASRVGGSLQSIVFAAAGIEPLLIPTVLFGRHPGLGAPGGGGVAPPLFASVLNGARAAGAFETDAVLTGYFADAAQVSAAAQAIRSARSAQGPPLIVVDPILGDEDGGLYVRDGVEAAVLGELAPLADLIAPNLFELGRITGALPTDLSQTLAAARRLGRPALVSSVPCRAGRIGALYVDGAWAILASHAFRPGAPKGTGDLLKALFLTERLYGHAPAMALEGAVRGVAAAVAAACAVGARDLPLVPPFGAEDLAALSQDVDLLILD